MLRKRVIPSLLLMNGGLVKTTGFQKPVYVGDPINAVKIFNEKEVDELFLFDITASRERRAPSFALIESIVSEAFMPVGYGGGIRSVDDARTLLKLGVEKVTLNTATFGGLELVRAISQQFGAQCVVGVIDIRKTWRGRYEVSSHINATVPERDPVRWAQQLVNAGAGEIVIQSVDRDGTQSGFDLDLMRLFHNRLSVPLVAAGGAASLDNMRAAFEIGGLSAISAGARFVFYGPHRAVLISYLAPHELAALNAHEAHL